MTFANELKRFRKDMGLTQADLATLLYSSVRSVSRWENGADVDERTTLFARDRMFHFRGSRQSV